MQFQYASDLHLEFLQNKKFLKEYPILPKASILLLAGDIMPFSQIDQHKDFFKYLADNFETTYWLPGNHEYYGYDLANKNGVIHEQITTNVHLVNNTTIEHTQTKLIFSTLWSKISIANQWYIERNLNDFRMIKFNSKRFSAEIYNQLHDESIQFIKQQLETNAESKKIVVTHHVPTFMNYPQQYIGSELNDAFATELFNLIEDKGPDYWIYGHHHTNTSEFTIGKTKLLTNQLGYVALNEQLTFSTLTLAAI